MKIALDAMSGDFAPISTVKGAIEALEESEGLQVILVGKEGIIKEELKKYKYDTSRIEIKNADEVKRIKQSIDNGTFKESFLPEEKEYIVK